MAWTFKYPDTDDFNQTSETYTYIQQYITNTDASMLNGTYENYIDISSFAKWILTHDILGTYDAGGSNIYCIKYDNTAYTKLKMTSCWDFDSIMQMQDSFSRIHSDEIFYYFYLFNSENYAFKNCYKDLWNTKKNEINTNILDYINTIKTSSSTEINNSRILDSKVYSETPSTIEQEINSISTWLSNRKTWLDTNINQL